MIEDIKNGLKLAGGVVELAKNINELSKSTNNLEIQEVAAELRSQTIDLKETVNEMRDRIMKLESQLEFKEQLSWNGQTFEYQKEGRTVYVCNGCESNRKYTHMSEVRGQNGYRAAHCPVCENKVILEVGSAPKINRESGGGWMSS
jgi:TolA-binding protein